MAESNGLSRRHFLKIVGISGGALVMGLVLPVTIRRVQADDSVDAAAALVPNAWLRIPHQGNIKIVVDRSEMGQGVSTAIPMLLAEELEISLDQVEIEFAPAHKDYVNKMIGMQATGGSTTVRDAWHRLRLAGAMVRELLIKAAAKTWKVSAEQCKAKNARIWHDQSGRSLAFGELIEVAATLSFPESVFVKEPGEFNLLGTPQRRLDIPSKLDGTAMFGIDVRVPDMLTATVLRCPVFGGKVKSFNDQRAREMKGVRAVLQIDQGIAVVADSFWQAHKAREKLQVEWDYQGRSEYGDSNITEKFQQLIDQPGAVVKDLAQTQTILDQSFTVSADYQVPYQAHACMEPMNCTADVRNDGCDIWVPTQSQTLVQQTAAKITGLPKESIRIHTSYLGGGFGRRFEQDFVREAVQISHVLKKAIKVVWTREDDIQHDYYRPACFNRLQAVLDASGNPIAWFHRIVGPSIMSRVFPSAVKGGVDNTSVEGASNLPYAIPNIRVEYHQAELGIPVGFWRSVGSSQNAYITECFLDELALAGNNDPLYLRRRLLKNAPRHLAVLNLAAEKAAWDKPAGAGVGRGIAVAQSFGSYVAQVAEVRLREDGSVQVLRVVCAIDCGMVVNPDIVKAQMESAIVFGLTAALKGKITIEKGRVVQSNFHDFELLRINEMPRIDVFIHPSREDPGGVGEPGTPPIAPAVANAVFSLTKRPVRQLPIHPRDTQVA